MWDCKTYLRDGRKACLAKQIPEDILLKHILEVLEVAAFDETHFHSCIQEISVPAANQLVFRFYDGRKIQKQWKDHSRKESWTAEAREKARQKAIQDRRKASCQN